MFGIGKGKRKAPGRSKECHKQLEFAGLPVTWVQRPYQKNLNLSVKPDGSLRVSSGKSLPVKELKGFLSEHKHWIQAAQVEYQKLRERFPPKCFEEGEAFQYLGYDYKLRFRFGDRPRIRFFIEGVYLNCNLQKSLYESPDRREVLRQALRRYYKAEAKKLITERVQFYSGRMNLHPNKLSFRSQKTRWGSCSSKGAISFNWRLIATPLAVVDYIIVHELAHLKYQNHSKNFWTLVHQYCPFYKRAQEWLKKYHYCVDFLAIDPELHPRPKGSLKHGMVEKL